ncbi:MAG: putative aminohydrolase SsnA [Campylobacteraceae bacterium]|nr:putative aminohydrolase SsnA [Campylobacteraceae bacterium]
MILIKNARVVTRDENNSFIENGAVLIDGKFIKEVGTTADLVKKYPDAEIKDAKNRLVMPGFINTHMHYYSTFARGMNPKSKAPTMFAEILTGVWWKLDKLLDLEGVYYSALMPMIDQIRFGVTSSIDHHASPNAVKGSLFKIEEAAKLAGVRSNLCYEISDRDGEKIAIEGIEENADFARHCKEANDDMIKGMFGFHASMTISDKTLDKSLQEAQDIGVGFHVHCAEGIEDVVDSIAKYDQRVIERWYKRGVLSDKSIAVHCINVKDWEIDMLRDSNVAVVTNPESNMGNTVGLTPMINMYHKGVLIGLGTDAYTADMMESLKVANFIVKHDAKDPTLGWMEAPSMLFENNRKIMNRFIDNEVGILKEGALADIIIVDYNAPTPVNGDNINGHVLFGLSGLNVDCTMVNGKFRMDERELVGIDFEEISSKSAECAKKVWAKL